MSEIQQTNTGHDALATQVLRLAEEKGVHIAAAESCTGGLIMAALTDIAGSSSVVERGFITYTNVSKIEVLGVRASTIRDHGAVSEQTAREMALGALKNSKAELCVAVTGIAGPGGGSADKPVGTVCFGLAFQEGQQELVLRTQTKTFEDHGRASIRASIRHDTVVHALTLMKAVLQDQ